MAQQYTVGKTATRIIRVGGQTQVVYHGTPVVTFTDKTAVLRTGGWYTLTTRTRMNQAANQFDLGFHVSQHNYQWYVRLPDGRTVPFEEGMSIQLRQGNPMLSHPRRVKISHTASVERKVRVGPKGGRYYLRRGRKVYV